MSLTLIKVLSSILAALATIWIGAAIEQSQMKRDFYKLAPAPAPAPAPASATAPQPVRRNGSPRGMAHALQHHEGH